METTSQTLGIVGEEIAVAHLKERGYRILLRNYRSPLGEIDMVARYGEYLVFLEVKTRSSLRMGEPAEAVTPFKRRQIIRNAKYYLNRQGQTETPCRFDVVSVLIDSKGQSRIDVIEDAFGEMS
ncbi:MAG: YraN family protein [Candidatus Omnitrophota bacterium]